MENAYLFSWNPDNYPIDKLEPIINKVKITGKATDPWSIGSHKEVKIGDRAFITRVNKDQYRGIFASGKIIAKDFKFLNWEQKNVPGVMIEFDTFLNPTDVEILEIDYIIVNAPPQARIYNWSPRPSGRKIDSIIIPALENLWDKFCVEKNVYNNSLDVEQLIVEGAPYQVTQTIYERSRYARTLCLNKYGYSCKVCGFNFKDTYGDIGKEFIHVHHLNQLAKGGTVITDPINDLRPVCPNCHAMLHKGNYSIEELKSKLIP